MMISSWSSGLYSRTSGSGPEARLMSKAAPGPLA